MVGGSGPDAGVGNLYQLHCGLNHAVFLVAEWDADGGRVLSVTCAVLGGVK